MEKLQNAVTFLLMCSTYSSAYSSEGSQDWKPAAEICVLLLLFTLLILTDCLTHFRADCFVNLSQLNAVNIEVLKAQKPKNKFLNKFKGAEQQNGQIKWLN